MISPWKSYNGSGKVGAGYSQLGIMALESASGQEACHQNFRGICYSDGTFTYFGVSVALYNFSISCLLILVTCSVG